jgi:hypothetical protein
MTKMFNFKLKKLLYRYRTYYNEKLAVFISFMIIIPITGTGNVKWEINVLLKNLQKFFTKTYCILNLKNLKNFFIINQKSEAGSDFFTS